MHNNPVSFLSKSKNFSTKKESPFYRRKKEEKAGNGSKWGTNRDFGQAHENITDSVTPLAVGERERTGKIL